MAGKTFSKAYSQYGASMGRMGNTQPAAEVTKLRLQRVPLDSGGYDPGGAYWGSGTPLYVAWGDGFNEQFEYYLRAYDREDAKVQVLKMCPNAKFYR